MHHILQNAESRVEMDGPIVEFKAKTWDDWLGAKGQSDEE